MRDVRTPEFDELADAGESVRLELSRLRDENSWLRRDNDALSRELASRARTTTAPLSLGTDRAPALVRGTQAVAAFDAPPPVVAFEVQAPAASSTPPPAAFVPPPLPTQGVSATQQGIDFGAVAQLTPDKLDGLPYGLITLDAKGRVIHYNDTEARLVGLPKERVIGRNFFREIAPCTRIREFEGRFEALAADPIGVRVQSFDFVFKFARGEQHVSVVMTPGRIRGQFHLALLRRARPA